MTQKSSQNLVALLQAVEKGKPALHCPSSKSLGLLCISRECKTSACSCLDQSCESCADSHNECECVKMSSLTNILRGLARQQRKITDKLVKITAKMIQDILRKMQEYEQEICFGYLAPEELQAILSIYLKETDLKFKGENFKDMFRKTKQVQVEIKDLEDNLVSKFEKEADVIAEQLRRLQDSTFSQFRDKFKAKLSYRTPKVDPKIVGQFEELRKKFKGMQSENQRLQKMICQIKDEKILLEEIVIKEKMMNDEAVGSISALQDELKIKEEKEYSERRKVQQLMAINQELRTQLQNRVCESCIQFQQNGLRLIFKLESSEQILRSPCLQDQDVFNSKIISRNNVEGIKFILQSLDKPKSVKLIFRASQHGFLISKFHQYCDGRPNTLTLITTQFGKIIGGFTPLEWSSGEEIKYCEDPSKRSFLLSVDLREKMTLHQTERATICWSNRGPSFGGHLNGFDVSVRDNCNVNKESFANFPSSYNCQGKYKKNQAAYTALCGNPKGNNFKVEEYEVFQVEW